MERHACQVPPVSRSGPSCHSGRVHVHRVSGTGSGRVEFTGGTLRRESTAANDHSRLRAIPGTETASASSHWHGPLCGLRPTSLARRAIEFGPRDLRASHGSATLRPGTLRTNFDPCGQRCAIRNSCWDPGTRTCTTASPTAPFSTCPARKGCRAQADRHQDRAPFPAGLPGHSDSPRVTDPKGRPS